MNEPLVSIIVPAYNAQLWLDMCCQSVLEQTYSNWELLIINDGSTDATGTIAQQLASQDSRIKITHTENGGVCRARNLGLDLAQGEFVVFLDADDILLPDSITLLYKSMMANGADIAAGQHEIIRADGTKVPSDAPLKQELWQGTEGLVGSLKDHPATYSSCAKLYKKTLLNDIRFVEGKRVHEDSYFVFECMMKKPAVVVFDSVVAAFRMSANSASRAPFSEKMFDILYFAQRKKERIASEFPEYNHLTVNMQLKANMALLRNLCKTRNKAYRTAEKACIRAIRSERKHFVPATAADRQWFWIITHRLYWAYKLCYGLLIAQSV